MPSGPRLSLLIFLLLSLGGSACLLGAVTPPEPAATEPHSGRFILRGASLPGGGTADLEVIDGRIAAVGSVPAPASPGAEEVVEASGQWIVPAFIDSHVHLAYYPAAAEMAAGGVAAVVDMAAPTSFLGTSQGPLQVLASGPMVTAVGGYPTQGWGAGGYGLQVSGSEEAAAAVSELHGLGAGLIKLPVTGGSQLGEPALRAAVERAHALGLKVSTHALGAGESELGAAVDCDLLAHTPTSLMSSEALQAWGGRGVVSSLRAFGGGDAALANLAALHARGSVVLYGTDFGNTRTPGIDRIELLLMEEAGLSAAEIIAAGTSVPAEYWGFDGLGALEVGKRASFLLLDADPHADIGVLATPSRVWLDGVEQ